MKGTIFTPQKCSICKSNLIESEKRDGFFCPDHRDIKANIYRIRYGRHIQKQFKSYIDAKKFLYRIRYQDDIGELDFRDYFSDSPNSVNNQVERYLIYKAKTLVKSKTVQSYKNILSKAVNFFGLDKNVKDIRYADIEDFLFSFNEISDKTRANYASCVHSFLSWLKRRQIIKRIPDIPVIKYELGFRTVIDISIQQQIINKIKEISFSINPKIYIGIKLLAFHINVRPGELIKIKEKDINLSQGTIFIRHSKEKRSKYIYLEPDEIDLLSIFPKAMPDLYFFRHGFGLSGVKEGQPFGDKYLKKWWDKACNELDINGVDLYGGTKHSTATALSSVLSPEQIKRGTGHRTNKAFERYFQADKNMKIKVNQAVRDLQNVIQFEAKKTAV